MFPHAHALHTRHTEPTQRGGERDDQPPNIRVSRDPRRVGHAGNDAVSRIQDQEKTRGVRW